MKFLCCLNMVMALKFLDLHEATWKALMPGMTNLSILLFTETMCAEMMWWCSKVCKMMPFWLEKSYVGLDMDPNYLTLWQCSWKNFLKKYLLEKVSRWQQKHEKLHSMRIILWWTKSTIITWHGPIFIILFLLCHCRLSTVIVLDFTYLSSDILNHSRQIMILCLLVLTPGHKPSSFPVVVIITQGHLGTDQYYFSENIS